MAPLLPTDSLPPAPPPRHQERNPLIARIYQPFSDRIDNLWNICRTAAVRNHLDIDSCRKKAEE
jgi:hypothetical protein